MWGVKQKGLFENTNSLGKVNEKGVASSLEALFYFDSLQASGQALASVFVETLVLLGILTIYGNTFI